MSLDAISAKNQMNEIARMAYGSGIFEGTSGGKGNIGLITGADGQARAIKFNTHSYERGGVATEDQIKSSNALRAQLLTIAESLNSGVMADLRAKLGLKDGEDATSCKTLLTRQVVASALKMIDKNAMSDAMKGVNASTLKSLGGTKFEEARIRTDYGISSTTLTKCGMSAADFEESINAMASKYNLTGAKKQVVGRITASYMTALAEEGTTGRVDRKTGIPLEGLPSKDEFKSQILKGNFAGTYFALQHVKVLSPTDQTFLPADNVVDQSVAELSRLMSDEECVDAAYYMAKLGTGPREAGGYNSISAIGCKAIIEKREELSAIRQKNGKLTIDDIYQTVLGKKAVNISSRGTAVDFTAKLTQQLYLHYKKEYPEIIEQRWGDDLGYINFEDSIAYLMQPMTMYGVSIDASMKISLRVDVDKIEVSHNASAYAIGSADYQKETEQSLFKQVEGDLRRAPNSVYTIGNGKDAYQLKVGAHPPQGEGMMTTEAKELMKELSRMLGLGDKIVEPIPNQLKTVCLLATQGGNTFLSLAGVSGTKDGQDHYPVDKSFSMMDDGAVLYTASSRIGDTVHTAQFRVDPNGDNTIIDYTRTKC
ncbi:MAG: hypothetical protein MJ109_00845 [Kiritimatiellae bacterium]|nr:hypothetical protein [Kiritimatiellia bacterium]